MVNGDIPTVASVANIYDAAYSFQRSEMDIMGTRIDKAYNDYTKEIIANWCKSAPSGPLLEIGTGDGDFGPFINSYQPERDWVGMDISHVGLSIARGKYPYLTPVSGDMNFLPYNDETFAAVILADTLEHSADIDHTLSEIHRVLKPDGVVGISVPDPKFFTNWTVNIVKEFRVDLFSQAAKAAIVRRSLFGNAKFQPIDHDLCPEEWVSNFQNSKFQVEECHQWPLETNKLPLVTLIKAKKVS